jgi:hypothetical protein
MPEEQIPREYSTSRGFGEQYITVEALLPQLLESVTRFIPLRKVAEENTGTAFPLLHGYLALKVNVKRKRRGLFIVV